MKLYIRLSIIIFIICIIVPVSVCAEGDFVRNQEGDISVQKDTADTKQLDEVEVTAKNAVKPSSTPIQEFKQYRLKELNALQVSDAVKHFSGVIVKDYGGIGGLKTVSVRSLGAAHTAVAIDGIAMGNAQNGQIDIGRFSLDNVDVISLTNGQDDQIFQSARQVSAASVLNIKSTFPEFDNKIVKGRVSFKGGSFGLLNPAATVAIKMSNKVAMTLSGEYLFANGRYPYVLEYGSEGDSSSVELRQNTDVENIRAELALYGKDSVQDGNVKAYFFQSKRGLPGATIFYNTANFSSQRITDRDIFVQGHYRRQLMPKLAFQLNAKYQYSFTHYLDPVYLGSLGKEENFYHQQEGYLSAGLLYNVLSSLSFSLNTDGIISTLDADLQNFAYPIRYQWLTALSGKYVNDWVIASATALFTVVDEEVRSGTASKGYFRVNPFVSATFKPFRKINLRFRVFYKNIFRLPTFNDLYYGRVGNINLKPESTNQYNVGITYKAYLADFLPKVELSCDVYHNSVRDKIVAYPTKNIYTWTMLNYGKVSINGIDFTGEVSLKPHSKVMILLGASYTYNRALNVTDPNSSDYKHQIPYTPRISGSGRASLQTPWFDINYSLIWSGHRYAVNQNYAENRVEGFFDHSISASHDFLIKQHVLGINLECLNLTNKNYAVVRYFPMPGRSWRATVYWKF
ncbi:MAG: TonB-dependent receptor [Bacteroidales bacterium]|nr:TonB-dependent receptor [Bacteroidales bacterium]MDD5975596.1 TonB-dependent receptor [Bacteroidales bacterium]MDY5194220.1 TonB-dependent receptor [Candidatus Aphodosoma sp.]